MRLIAGAASLLALALFVVPAGAEDAPADAAAPAAQQEVAPLAEAAAPAALSRAVQGLLADTRPASELSVDELRKRLKAAQAASQDENLPQDIRDQMAGLASGAKAELGARAQAAADQKAAEEAAQQKAAADKAAQDQAAADKAAQEQAAADKAAQDQAAAEKAAAASAAKEQAAQDQAAADKAAAAKADKEQAAAEKAAADKAAADQTAADQATKDKAGQQQVAPPALPDGLQTLLADTRQPSELSVEELQARFKQIRRFEKIENLPVDVAVQLASLGKQARAELDARQQAANKPGKPVAVEPTAPAVPAAPEVQAPVVVTQAPPPPKELPPAPPPPPESKPLPQVAAAPPPPPPASVAPSVADAKVLDNNSGDPAAEKQAKAYLGDNSDIAKLSDDALRARLDAIRDLMASNELSRDTERAVRTKLKTEREVLRQRIALAEAAQQLKNAQANAANPPPPVQGAKPQMKPAPQVNVAAGIFITNATPRQQVLRDRRPSENLDVNELQLRIQIFGDAQTNNNYDPTYRDYWRATADRDRAFLRRRMIEERHRREAELAEAAAADTIDVQLEPDYVPRRKPRRDVFAAEINDQEMEDVLVAPPERYAGANLKQRYKVDDIAAKPQLRQSISRIEIDTIRFGYNEGFIRDEQVGNLDGIAAIIERIVKKYPNEVFLIEGHTDAPGSALYNQKLSKLRAESIKRALTSYYVIPARNLRTVGLGERFLKIPTSDAEPENRRVSVARITQLLGAN
jgi:outer membrane protein OmpA-like peptidoglycan-associated protein